MHDHDVEHSANGRRVVIFGSVDGVSITSNRIRSRSCVRSSECVSRFLSEAAFGQLSMVRLSPRMRKLPGGFGCDRRQRINRVFGVSNGLANFPSILRHLIQFGHLTLTRRIYVRLRRCGDVLIAETSRGMSDISACETDLAV
jgi:hypothetical protein